MRIWLVVIKGSVADRTKIDGSKGNMEVFFQIPCKVIGS